METKCQYLSNMVLLRSLAIERIALGKYDSLTVALLARASVLRHYYDNEAKHIIATSVYPHYA